MLAYTPDGCLTRQALENHAKPSVYRASAWQEYRPSGSNEAIFLRRQNAANNSLTRKIVPAVAHLSPCVHVDMALGAFLGPRPLLAGLFRFPLGIRFFSSL